MPFQINIEELFSWVLKKYIKIIFTKCFNYHESKLTLTINYYPNIARYLDFYECFISLEKCEGDPRFKMYFI